MVKPYFFPELWINIGWYGVEEAIEESRLGEESLEDERSEERECGDIGLPKGETPNTSGTDELPVRAHSNSTETYTDQNSDNFNLSKLDKDL